MQHCIQVVGANWVADSYPPGRLKTLIIGVAALGARPMAGGERRRLVKEEQLGIRVGTHELASAPAKRGAAGDPAPDLPGAHKASGVVVQDATIAHQEASLREGDDLAKRRHPILQRHRHLLFLYRPLILD